MIGDWRIVPPEVVHPAAFEALQHCTGIRLFLVFVAQPTKLVGGRDTEEWQWWMAVGKDKSLLCATNRRGPVPLQYANACVEQFRAKGHQ